MRNNFTLSIPKPCSEQWSNLTPAATGGFCSSCNKTVVDFTQTQEDDIIRFFKDKSEGVCGRFAPHQLKHYESAFPVIQPGFPLLKAAVVSALMLVISKNSFGQTQENKNVTPTVQLSKRTKSKTVVDSKHHIVRGIVIDPDSKEGLPGINVVHKGTVQGTITDAYGAFEFPHKLKQGDVLVFSFIGYETKEWTVPKTFEARVELTLKLCMDIYIMGEVASSELYHEEKTGLWSKIKSLF